jgi:NADH:ubiquinone oxidoreductase subunit H
MPQTSMVPLSITSSRSMQRSAVLLPEPLAPMIAIISPLATSNETPFKTWFEPKLL